MPSTATQSYIACVFSEGSEKLPSGMVVAKKSKKEKESKNQKIQQKNQKNSKKLLKKHGVRIFEYSPVSLGVYSGTSLHCCAQPYLPRIFVVIAEVVLTKETLTYSLNFL